MINVRSTYYRTVNLPSPACAEYTINIYIWSGALGSVPATPTYSITRTNYESLTSSESVEIGRIIKSYIEPFYTGVSGGGNYTSQTPSMQTYVKTDVQFDGAAKTDAQTTIALYGYGYGNEGINPQNPTNGLLITNNIFKVSRDTDFTIPVYCDVAKDVVITTPNSTYSNSFIIPSTTDSDEIIQLIKIDTSTISEIENYVLVDVDDNLIYLFLDNDEKYTNTDLYFINKYGGQQTVSMRKERSESMNINKETYERSFGQPGSGYHQNLDYLINAKTTIKLNSGYIPEQNNLTFKELLLSDYVWMNYDGEIVPVNIASSNIDYKTRSVDKLINYEISVTHAFNEINTI